MAYYPRDIKNTIKNISHILKSQFSFAIMLQPSLYLLLDLHDARKAVLLHIFLQIRRHGIQILTLQHEAIVSE